MPKRKPKKNTEKPHDVNFALNLLWIILIVDIIMDITSNSGITISTFLWYGTIGILLYLIGQRKNWARILIIIYSIIIVVIMLLAFGSLSEGITATDVSPFRLLTMFVLTIMYIIAIICLLSKESKDWFN